MTQQAIEQFLDDQYGILLPTPHTRALFNLEECSDYQWNKRIRRQLIEGQDWLKRPDPRNNNTPTIYYSKAGLLRLCSILGRADLEPMIATIRPRGGAMMHQPTYIQWQEPQATYSDVVVEDTRRPAFAGQWEEPGELVAPTRPGLAWNPPELQPYFPPISDPAQQQIELAKAVESARNQAFTQIHQTADLVLRIQNETHQRTNAAANAASDRTAAAYDKSLKSALEWLFLRDDPAALLCFGFAAAIVMICGIALFDAATARDQPQQLIQPSAQQQI